MKRIVLVLVMLLSLCSLSHAALDLGDLVEKLPPLKQGVAYSIQDNKFNYISTVELIEYKGWTLEAGYAGIAENTKHKAVGVISYPIVKVKDLGVNVPILDLIEANLGLYGGLGQIDISNKEAEFDWGVSLTLLNIKW